MKDKKIVNRGRDQRVRATCLLHEHEHVHSRSVLPGMRTCRDPGRVVSYYFAAGRFCWSVSLPLVVLLSDGILLCDFIELLSDCKLPRDPIASPPELRRTSTIFHADDVRYLRIRRKYTRSKRSTAALRSSRSNRLANSRTETRRFERS
jgi:hypothetical protein